MSKEEQQTTKGKRRASLRLIVETNPCAGNSPSTWVRGLDDQKVSSSGDSPSSSGILRATQLSVFLFLLVTQLCVDLVAVAACYAVSGCLETATMPLAWTRRRLVKAMADKVRPAMRRPGCSIRSSVPRECLRCM